MINKNYFKCSFIEIDITPDFQVELIGAIREDSISKGVLHNLYGQILLIEFNGEYFCLIAIDSLGLTIELSNKLRLIVSEKLQTDISNIMVNFSHTHSAPAPLSPVNGEKYLNLLFKRIKNGLENSLNNLKPCSIGWDLSETEIGENRRDGCTDVDKRILGIRIADFETDESVVYILRVVAHANILMKENEKISSDYFGVARNKISKYFNSPVMIIQGAAGNIKPVGVDRIFGGNLSDLDRITDILLNSVKKLHFNMENIFKFKMYEKEIEYKSDVPSKEKASDIALEAKKLFGIDGSLWLSECEGLRNNGFKFQIQKRKIQFFILNEIWICGVPEEIFSEIAIETVKKTGYQYIFLNGYTNGCTGYLPHADEWVKGGYETLYSYLSYYNFHGHVMPFQKDTAKRIVETVYDQWKRFK